MSGRLRRVALRADEHYGRHRRRGTVDCERATGGPDSFGVNRRWAGKGSKQRFATENLGMFDRVCLGECGEDLRSHFSSDVYLFAPGVAMRIVESTAPVIVERERATGKPHTCAVIRKWAGKGAKQRFAIENLNMFGRVDVFRGVR